MSRLIPPPSPITSIRLGDPVPSNAMRSIERAMQLRYFKWDTQVGDTSVLCPQPLLMAQSTWDWLSAKAEEATSEIYALEQAIACDPALQKLIGVPAALGKQLVPDTSINNLRTLRFDFHPTSTGWFLSEVNTDVPGGFGEASALPALYSHFQEQATTPPCALTTWGDAVEAEVAPGHVALMCAPGHLEDQQVVLTLGRELRRRGFTPHLVQSPAALRWQDGWAYLAKDASVRLCLIVRFFQAEWLAQLSGRSGWQELFKKQSGTRILNPSVCVISESKRLPLAFKDAGTNCTTLQKFLPEYREPMDVEAAQRREWVLKATYSNTGDEVYLGAERSQHVWEKLLKAARRNPAGWIAQRRFDTDTLASTRGLLKPCVGIFVIGNRAAGAYVRLSPTQVTDAHALETPLFIVPDHTLS